MKKVLKILRANDPAPNACIARASAEGTTLSREIACRHENRMRVSASRENVHYFPHGNPVAIAYHAHASQHAHKRSNKTSLQLSSSLEISDIPELVYYTILTVSARRTLSWT